MIQSYEQFRFGYPDIQDRDQDWNPEVSSHILLNLESIAFCDFQNDRNGRWLSTESK